MDSGSIGLRKGWSHIGRNAGKLGFRVFLWYFLRQRIFVQGHNSVNFCVLNGTKRSNIFQMMTCYTLDGTQNLALGMVETIVNSYGYFLSGKR